MCVDRYRIVFSCCHTTDNVMWFYTPYVGSRAGTTLSRRGYAGVVRRMNNHRAMFGRYDRCARERRNRPVHADACVTDVTGTALAAAQDGRRRLTGPRSGRTGQDSTTEY